MIRLALAAILSLLALPLSAAPLSLSTLSAYLNSLTQFETAFQQENSDGSRSAGHIYIHRPGRMRLDYDPPEKSLVIVAGSQVVVFDGRSNEPPQQYPLARTPLNLILAPQIDLGTAKMVVGLAEVQGLTHVVAQDPAHPDYGNIELIFAANPVRLTGWVLTDDSGNQTVVKLGEFQAAESLPATLFSPEIEVAKRKK
jgi:outer membrane lipoprotein-sorting protein